VKNYELEFDFQCDECDEIATLRVEKIEQGYTHVCGNCGMKWDFSAEDLECIDQEQKEHPTMEVGD